MTVSRRQFVSSVLKAYVYAGLNENDKAFECLSRAYEEQSDLLVNLKADPFWDPVRSDSRYAALLHKMKLDH